MNNPFRNLLSRGAAVASVAVVALALTTYCQPAAAAAISSSYVHHYPG